MVLHSGHPQELECQPSRDWRICTQSICTDEPGETKTQKGESLAQGHTERGYQPQYSAYSLPGTVNSRGLITTLRGRHIAPPFYRQRKATVAETGLGPMQPGSQWWSPLTCLQVINCQPLFRCQEDKAVCKKVSCGSKTGALASRPSQGGGGWVLPRTLPDLTSHHSLHLPLPQPHGSPAPHHFSSCLCSPYFYSWDRTQDTGKGGMISRLGAPL